MQIEYVDKIEIPKCPKGGPHFLIKTQDATRNRPMIEKCSKCGLEIVTNKLDFKA